MHVLTAALFEQLKIWMTSLLVYSMVIGFLLLARALLQVLLLANADTACHTHSGEDANAARGIRAALGIIVGIFYSPLEVPLEVCMSVLLNL